MAISFEQAEKVLSGAVRSELRDHAFGDREVTWRVGEEVVAEGYSGSSGTYVTVYPPGGYQREFDGEEVETGDFEGYQARELIKLGASGVIERNDSTGPSTYREGQVMPALTLEGVLRELTGS